MFVLIGTIVVFASLLIGYTMHGGKIAALMQISEFIIIGGAGLGSVIIAFSLKGAISTSKGCLSLLKGNPYSKSKFLELLRVMYDLFVLSRKEGPLALEKHIEDPHNSELFQNYPFFLQNHHAVDFCTDTLKLITMGGVNLYDLSDLMDLDLEAQHEESMKVTNILATIGDAMPGFGIVAAVLGVVITMQAIGGPPEEVGYSVAAALVGTFLGVFLAYGVFMPLSRATETIAKAEEEYVVCIKQSLLAYARGDSPLVCVEFARRGIQPEYRPGFSELEDACRSRGKGESEQAMAA